MFSFLFFSHTSVFISLFCVSIYFTAFLFCIFQPEHRVFRLNILFLSIITSPNKCCSLESSVLLSFMGSLSLAVSSEACCALYLKLASVSCDFCWTLVMSYLSPFDAIVVFSSTKIQSWICCAQRVWYHSHIFSQKFRHCWEASSAWVKSVAFYDDSKLEWDKISLSASPVSLRSSLILSGCHCPYVPSDVFHLGFLANASLAFFFFAFVKHHTYLILLCNCNKILGRVQIISPFKKQMCLVSCYIPHQRKFKYFLWGPLPFLDVFPPFIIIIFFFAKTSRSPRVWQD